MKIKVITAMSIASVAAAVGLAATAHADNEEVDFQSPSGNIACTMLLVPGENGNNNVQCDLGDHTFQTPGTCRTSATGVAAILNSSRPQPDVGCDAYASLLPSSWPVLEYGQSRSLGVLRCNSEPSGITCTNTKTGHFFRLSRDSYQVG
ncbi:DUF6636 domain-containing protein [Mycobacterium sp. E796]|uniref:DUF6636 domain-containing protein n=1 Tax=Mycobacterium sp. E796 TaxID=1834151 RepID=UPI000A51076B|nr:DUF6636 domain-containing protein [Mycobacterium sp. E796]